MFLIAVILMANAATLASNPPGELYSKAYGEKSDPALIFLHGGPGYNAFPFEKSTAQKLANKGFYVIVFDQAGCGRSKNVPNSQYTFEEAFKNIEKLYDQYGIEKASLIGHSWGGTLGVFFAKNNPRNVDNLIMLSSPLSYQRMYKTIIAHCKEVYKEENSQQLKYIKQLEKMDSTSLEFSSYSLTHARNCGLYSTENQTQHATTLYKKLEQHKNAQLLNDFTRSPVSGFYKNEAYTTINLAAPIKNLRDQVDIFGIYGAKDGLFDRSHLRDLKNLIGEEAFFIIDNASHNVYLDQQTEFIKSVNKFLKK